jgi:hypothetical protein
MQRENTMGYIRRLTKTCGEHSIRKIRIAPANVLQPLAAHSASIAYARSLECSYSRAPNLSDLLNDVLRTSDCWHGKLHFVLELLYFLAK